MKTSSVEFISRSPNPLPMKSKHRSVCVAPKIFEPWQWKRRKKRNRFEQTSRTLQRENIDAFNQKINLLKRRSYACETHVFSCGTFRMSKRCLHMMEKLSSSTKF
ncbi:hypothetical protein TNCV_4323321 [Trichonephila clavipes]|nr:hypothetical protein TNCV_4323321 [Trichonephila clavipes]